MKPPRTLAAPAAEPIIDEYADTDTAWRQQQAKESLHICRMLMNTIKNLAKETKSVDITKAEKSKLATAIAKLSDAHTKKQEEARKLGAVKVPSETKEPLGNKPPRTPIQFPTVVSPPAAAS